MGVHCGIREPISALASSTQIDLSLSLRRARDTFVEHRSSFASHVTLPTKWMATAGNLRFRGHQSRPSPVLGETVSQRQTNIIFASSPDSNSLTDDAEDDSRGQPESVPFNGSVDLPQAAFGRDIVSSASSEATFDGCIAEFVLPSEQQILVTMLVGRLCFVEAKFRFAYSSPKVLEGGSSVLELRRQSKGTLLVGWSFCAYSSYHGY